ncbi:calmodulin-binding protein 25-like [Aristolochia californica]|uniref:calmodulin-binding protein 25-like n=1 Tax=Aristolochia californica TaxID=171875 RepID=UPI0035DC3C27
MASSDNVAAILEPWAFRSPLADTWISEAFARDTDALTKALQESLSSHKPDPIFSTSSPFLNSVKSELGQPLYSSSDPESSSSKPPRDLRIPASGKISKRKSRATKRSPTTFITADPANFRQMVQQVTGARLGDGQMPVCAVARPEPHRAVNRLQGFLPTLDTSTFLLDHHQQQVMGSSTAIPQVSFGSVNDAAPGFDFDTFQNFPTLESWR